MLRRFVRVDIQRKLRGGMEADLDALQQLDAVAVLRVDAVELAGSQRNVKGRPVWTEITFNDGRGVIIPQVRIVDAGVLDLEAYAVDEAVIIGDPEITALAPFGAPAVFHKPRAVARRGLLEVFGGIRVIPAHQNDLMVRAVFVRAIVGGSLSVVVFSGIDIHRGSDSAGGHDGPLDGGNDLLPVAAVAVQTGVAVCDPDDVVHDEGTRSPQPLRERNITKGQLAIQIQIGHWVVFLVKHTAHRPAAHRIGDPIVVVGAGGAPDLIAVKRICVIRLGKAEVRGGIDGVERGQRDVGIKSDNLAAVGRAVLDQIRLQERGSAHVDTDAVPLLVPDRALTQDGDAAVVTPFKAVGRGQRGAAQSGLGRAVRRGEEEDLLRGAQARGVLRRLLLGGGVGDVGQRDKAVRRGEGRRGQGAGKQQQRQKQRKQGRRSGIPSHGDISVQRM